MANKTLRQAQWYSFTVQDVVKYLERELRGDDFLVMTQPASTENCVMAEIGGTYFLICANKVQRFEIACHYRFARKIRDVIEALKKWNRLNGPRYLIQYVDEKKQTYHVFFENGEIPSPAYSDRFVDAKVEFF